MTAIEYMTWRKEDRPHFLLDVRQPEEYAVARLDGATLIPLDELHGREKELPKDRPVVVLCHHGVRSAHAVHHLREAGIDAVNLSGGIDAWSREVDQKVPIY